MQNGKQVIRDGQPLYTNVETTIPVPDLFRTEAPFVERNVRLDYLGNHHLQDPRTDESQFFTEISYSFTERLGIIFSAPVLIRNNFGAPGTSGYGDVESGIRYVLFGDENDAPFKLALGFNVEAPTGDAARELGEGHTLIEPEVLMFQKISEVTFLQEQFSIGTPTSGAGRTTEFSYNLAIGHVFRDISNSEYFLFPTAVFELNGRAGSGGMEAGVSIVDLTAGLRWFMGSKAIAGIAMSAPVTQTREFEQQFIFSIIYRYGPPEEEAPSGAPSSRAYF